MTLLVPGDTCWRIEQADHFAGIVDGADYFRHVKAAMMRARHRVMLIGWDFDTRMTFERGDKTLAGPNQLRAFLWWLLRLRPDLEIYLLKSNLGLIPAFQTIWDGVTPVKLLNWLSSDRLWFAVDGAHPTGAVHHQKIVVVDDVLAFCGGIDLTVDRWDTSEHLQHNTIRRTMGRAYGPRHEVAVAVDGAAARALGDQARNRWRAATKQLLGPIEDADRIWPPGLEPSLRRVGVGIARTLPAQAPGGEVREVEALNRAAIAAGRRTIYLENQYLASRPLVSALASRLQEPDGPEIVIVLPRRSESRLERESMDTARHDLLEILWAADDHHRLGVYWPVADGGAPVYVHSKVLVSDDRLLRIGSSNLNNRSMGFDSECDVAIEADPDDRDHDAVRRVITATRDGLVGEHLGVPAAEVASAVREHGSFLNALRALRGPGRTLVEFTADTVRDEAGRLAENDLMDPDRVPRSITRTVQRLFGRLTE
ncbi:phospholipase D-like domain-containing protein [Mycolicibacterium sp. D5.8-2]|uniref:phospholipase D-like domain-containing protein n=1 Tax=Mycolicibacterium sp. D5.8-2 TaxID=3085903 RepID=UPI00298C5298|nr:phospholipase D-like domain-containing protein [Mycolicibacterium sp. D5.8-2]MDW5609441.1 phospholipase D-like domain-containing protein [Mycolicibacterium sp. D5.8-2]